MSQALIVAAVGISIVAVPASTMAAGLKAGIYRLADEGAGTRVMRSVGGTVDLGDLLSGNFGDVSIWSVSNHNDRFRVLMKRTGPLDTQGRLAIYAAGVCEVVGSHSEPDAEGKVELIVDVAGQANAARVATALEVNLQQRQHPGHQLLVKWTPVKETLRVGEPVELELQLTNVGATVVRFMDGGQQRGARNNQFGFTAFAGSGFGKPLPDVGDPANFGGLAAFRTLKPGDVFRKRAELTKWFHFDKADTYQITGMFELELRDKDHGPQVLWLEFATGRCLVKISE